MCITFGITYRAGVMYWPVHIHRIYKPERRSQSVGMLPGRLETKWVFPFFKWNFPFPPTPSPGLLTQPRTDNNSVRSLTRVWLFATPWTAARQASLSITNSRSLPKLMSIESVIPSSHLILCRPLLLPPVPPSIRVFSNESTLHMRWPKY